MKYIKLAILMMWNSMIMFVSNNLRYVSDMFLIASIVATLLLYKYHVLGYSVIVYIGIGIVLLGIGTFIQTVADIKGVGNEFPIPEKRFTSVHDGRVDIMQHDIPNAMMYLRLVEDYLQRIGRLKDDEEVQ